MESIHQQFFNLTTDMLCIFNVDGHWIDFNESFCRTLGYQREELLSKSYRELIHPDDLAQTQEVATSVKAGTALKDFTNRYMHKNGGIVFINWEVHHDLEKKITWSVGRNITNVILNQSYITRWASLAEMASGVAHEINNPLTIILAYLSQLKQQMQGLENLQLISDLEKIEKNCQRIVKIVNSLQEVSHPASSSKSPVLLKQALNRSLELCRARFEKNRIRFKVSGDFDSQIFANSAQISQVFFNILNNAFDAVVGTTEPWIEVCGEVRSHQAYIQISNSGVKIPKELQDKIMHPFFTTKEVGSATGLGLSVSKNIIENHGGNLLLDVQGPYTAFNIQLPIFKNHYLPARELEII